MKQKTVYPDAEVPHLWAHQSQEHAKGKGHVSFRGPVFYSYSTAIGRICEHKGQEYALLNTRSFSATTSKHQSMARHAVSHMPAFSGDWGGYGGSMDIKPKDIVAYYKAEAEAMAKETSRYKHKMFSILVGAAQMYDRAKDAAEFFGFGFKKLEQAGDALIVQAKEYKEAHDKHVADSDSRRAARNEARRKKWEKYEQDRKAAALEKFNDFMDDFTVDHVPSRHQVPEDQLDAFDAQIAKRTEWAKEQKALDIEAWKRGEDMKSYLYDVPVMLRVVAGSNDHSGASAVINKFAIETSHGVRIPYEDGKRCFQFYIKIREKGWHRNGESFKVGNYQLDACNENGIVAGCHRISHEEVMRFATQEGWA